MIKFILAIVALFGAIFATYRLGERAEHDKQQLTIDRLHNDLAQANANSATLQTAIARQNAKIRANSEADARSLAEAATQVAQAQARTRDAEAVAARLLRPLAATERCARADEAFARLKETLP